MTREEAALIILSAPPNVRHAELGRLTGYSESFARRVRIGASWRDVLPELPRQVARGQATCRKCRLFDDDKIRCSLGFPEATGTDGLPRFSAAKECNSYFQQ
jgi:hypothetical protein